MCDELVLNPDEVGIVIFIKEDKNTYKYIGKNQVAVESKALEKNISYENLNKLDLFKSDRDVIPWVNEYRQKGINARMLSVFRHKGKTIIDADYTSEYIKNGLIKKIEKRSEKFIYKIDHYYSYNHDEYCLMISTEINKDKLATILSCIQFKFEELVDETGCIDDQHLLIILKKFYGIKDVKENYSRFLSQTSLEDSEWETFNIFNIKDEEIGEFKIIQIDLYKARERLLCGSKYEEQIDAVIPENKDDFEREIKNLRNFYSYIERGEN